MQKRSFFLNAIILFTAFVFFATGVNSTEQGGPRKPDFDVIVIGAGMGGLSAAAHLGTNKLKVLVLEQHDKVGGCTTNFRREDFIFDASLHEMAGGGPGKNNRGYINCLRLQVWAKKLSL